MRVKSSSLPITVLAIGLLCQSVIGQMLSPNHAPVQRIVVLSNGEVLSGRVSESATNTIVETAQGSRLVLGKDQVDFVCDSIRDAYWGKCARTQASDVDGQKSLFFWCLKHELHEQAQNQILLLTASEKAKPSDIAYLDRQLSVAITQLQKQNKANTQRQQAAPPAPMRLAQASRFKGGLSPSQLAPNQLAPNHPNRIASDLPRLDQIEVGPIELSDAIGTGRLVDNSIDFNAFRPLPALNTIATPAQSQASLAPIKPADIEKPIVVDHHGMIQQVGFEEEIVGELKTISLGHRMPNPVKVAEKATPAEVVTVEELDRMTRSMPQGTIGPYRSRLERVLLNGCNASNCHDSKSDVMPLMELGRSKPIPRRMSQRNLHQTLKYIDRDNPFDSPLLAAASQPHAGVEKPILPVGSKHFEQLKLWVIMLSQDPDANYQAYLNPELQKKIPAQPIIEEASHSSQPNIVPVEPERIGLQPLASPIEHSQTIGEIPELTTQPDNYQPVDPFDPEIFNRRFGRQ